MKKLIIFAVALSAVLLLLFYCTDYKFENPLDKKGTNYLYGDTTNEQEKIGDANGNGISDLFDIKYTVTFYANGGGGSLPPAQTVLKDLSITLPSGDGLSRTGYTFDRWCTTPSGMGTYHDAGSVFTPSLNMSFYARWKLILYTVEFDANGGTVSPTSDTTGEGWKLASLPTPTRSGYIFEGWFTEATGGTKVEASKAYTADITIYAQWGATFTDSRDGTTYKKVTIGTQTWMGQNLNYDTSGSKCYGEGGQVYDNGSWKTLTSDEVAANCAKYGRLYNWATVMNGASSSSLSPSGVRGVCPVGWHVPSHDEWTTLTDYVGGASTAGTKLKAASGWDDYYGRSGNGTDQYGFAALPGGGGGKNGYFGLVAGLDGCWWSATKGNANIAWNRLMRNNDGEVVGRNYNDESGLLSVRCVQD